MRTTKELLQLIRQEIEEHGCTGICSRVLILSMRGQISPAECNTIDSFLDMNLPQKIGFCWLAGDKKPRLKWLDQQILLLESYEVEEKV
jgi:hypothetical protein